MREILLILFWKIPMPAFRINTSLWAIICSKETEGDILNADGSKFGYVAEGKCVCRTQTLRLSPVCSERLCLIFSITVLLMCRGCNCSEVFSNKAERKNGLRLSALSRRTDGLSLRLSFSEGERRFAFGKRIFLRYLNQISSRRRRLMTLYEK